MTTLNVRVVDVTTRTTMRSSRDADVHKGAIEDDHPCARSNAPGLDDNGLTKSRSRRMQSAHEKTDRRDKSGRPHGGDFDRRSEKVVAPEQHVHRRQPPYHLARVEHADSDGLGRRRRGHDRNLGRYEARR